MNRRGFFTSVLVGVGIAPVLLNATIKDTQNKFIIVQYGDFITYDKNRKQAKRILIDSMNYTFKKLKIKKRDIASIEFIEKSRKENDDLLAMSDKLGWRATVRERK